MECGFTEQRLLVQFGPTVSVNIGFDPKWKVGGPDSKSSITSVHALVDTGATESCIDSMLASTLGLPIADRRSISGVSGRTKVNVYMAQVHIPAMALILYGMFTGVDLRKGGQVHSALLGRTFLQHFQMTYSGTDGQVTISHPD